MAAVIVVMSAPQELTFKNQYCEQNHRYAKLWSQSNFPMATDFNEIKEN